MPLLERALLACIMTSQNKSRFQDLRDELKELARSAGAVVVREVVQRKEHLDPALLLGRGKVEETALLVQEEDANIVIFLNELSPVQQRNLERELHCKVIDRTALILDIFAQRAKSREGKLQVELAQLNWLLPRLTGRGVEMSRLGGGIGTRGPGETQLETDRRRINSKIKNLKKKLAEVQRHRHLLRTGRVTKGHITAALVGYTNAGKSTLLNALAKARTFVEDKLFATLDPTVRSLWVPLEAHAASTENAEATSTVPSATGRDLLLIDTVGFIQKLPPQLVAAFRATLEEVTEATFLIHVADASHPFLEDHLKIVEEILIQLEAQKIPRILVLNKIDLCSPGLLSQQRIWFPQSVLLSARTGEGLVSLKKTLSDMIKIFLSEAEMRQELTR